jgi:hypothetical protein
MLRLIPWDVWIAGALAAAAGFAAMLNSEPTAILALYASLCALIIVEIVTEEVG